MEQPDLNDRLQCLQQGFGAYYWRLAGAAAADESPCRRSGRLRDLEQSLGKRFRKAIWDQLFRSDANHDFIHSKARNCKRFKTFGFCAGADNNYLHRVEQQPLKSQPVRAGVEAKVLDDSGKGG